MRTATCFTYAHITLNLYVSPTAYAREIDGHGSLTSASLSDAS